MGDSALHEIVYGESMQTAAKNFAAVCEQLKDVTTQIREGQGVLHQIIYEKKHAQILDDLATAMTNVREITATLAQGKGTLGMLLRDPSVYEDLKLLLSTGRRNTLLHSLVLWSIRSAQEEQEKKKQEQKKK